MHQLCSKAQAYKEEQYPDDWGKAIILRLHNKDGTTDRDKYRAISLLYQVRMTDSI